MKLKHFCMGAALSVAMVASTAVSAATYLLTFTDTSSNVDATITLTTGGALGGGLAVTSATGSIEGSGASLLGTASATYETSPSNTFYYDDLLFLGSTPTNLDVDTYGLLFTSDGLEWNLYSNGGAPGTEALQSDGGEYFTGDITVVAVPEPATWGLMILGVGLMGTGLRMVRRKTALASV